LRRLIISAPQGRSGKTTVAIGLCAALTARGLRVQPFKKGPDYIDPSWLTEAAGRPCRNLDPYLMGRDTVVAAFLHGCQGADMAIIEGAMGLYDGLDLEGSGSTAALARWLGAPIFLVIDARRMTRSVAALVQGYQRFEPDIPLAGVILNNVAGSRHQAMLSQAIERYCGLPVVGILPRSATLSIPDRHLGLVPRGEDEALLPAIAAAREAVLANFDLDRILAISEAGELPGAVAPRLWVRRGRVANQGRQVKIGIIRDQAFSFYYPENLEALQEVGATLIFINSLEDEHLPAVDALYIGGGFPEVFMGELEANARLRGEIRAAIEAGLPVYAECGGLMYLGRGITWGDKSGQMVGVLPIVVHMTGRPQGHGYVELTVEGNNPFFAPGLSLRGHEFHHSRVEALGPLSCAYRLSRGQGIGGQRDGLVYKNVLASYAHLHALGTPEWAPALVARAAGC